MPEQVTAVDIDPEMGSHLTERLMHSVEVIVDDFFDLDLMSFNPTLIIANPPYGSNRELNFFLKCNREASKGTLLIFLMPLSFIDRVPDVKAEVLEGRPLGVTTGHAIVVHRAGDPFTVRPIHRPKGMLLDDEFEVLTGLKIYETGAGSPPQTAGLIRQRPFSSEIPVAGWLPCLRTGDLDESNVKVARLWVDYGAHLASPKSMDRFEGPRLVMRRVPIWSSKRLCAHFIEEAVLCAGDLLVIKHVENSPERLVKLAIWLSSDFAAELIHKQRPSVKHRASFPKISAKDVNWLISEWRKTEVTS
jgi:hypothetical protein